MTKSINVDENLSNKFINHDQFQDSIIIRKYLFNDCLHCILEKIMTNKGFVFTCECNMNLA